MSPKPAQEAESDQAQTREEEIPGEEGSAFPFYGRGPQDPVWFLLIPEDSAI